MDNVPGIDNVPVGDDVAVGDNVAAGDNVAVDGVAVSDGVALGGNVAVTVIIPAFNEAHRLPRSIPRLLPTLRRMDSVEVIIVDDGSTDGTAAMATELLRDVPGGRVVRLPWNAGKGTAVRTGVSVARGQSIVFMDADMASDVNDLPFLLSALQHAEVVLGSRRLGEGALRTGGRRLGSWAFNQVTRSFAALDVADTQCGFKAFRQAEAKILFSMSRSTGFGFDVEVLSIARAMGYRIVEVPVRWAETPGGTFSVTRHTPAMIVDVVRSRRYLRRYAPALRTDPQPGIAGVPTQPMAPLSGAPERPGATLSDTATGTPSGTTVPGATVVPGASVVPGATVRATPARLAAVTTPPVHPVPVRHVLYTDNGTRLTTIGFVTDTATVGELSAEPPASQQLPRKVI